VTIQDFPYKLTRAGVVMGPDADEPYEVEGCSTLRRRGRRTAVSSCSRASSRRGTRWVWLRLGRGRWAGSRGGVSGTAHRMASSHVERRPLLRRTATSRTWGDPI